MVYPEDADQVQAIVKYARSSGVNLVPCSSPDGPRTTGSSLPSEADGSVAVNLSKMNRIVRVDARNRVAIVEPGVTFPELSAAVADQGLRVSYPLLPRPTKSVLGSYLDREPTLIPRNHWDASDPLLCVEMVFGSGELFRTGSAAGPGTLEEQWASGVAQNAPLGPAHTDLGRATLGAQGTMGIVTWGSVRLDLKPSIRKLLYVQADDVGRLEPFVYQGIRRRLGDEYLVLNSTALASTLQTSAEDIVRARAGLPEWTLILVIAGYRYLPEEKLIYQEKDLAQIASQSGLALKESLPGIDNARVFSLLDSASDGASWKHRLEDRSVDIFFLSTLDQAGMFHNKVMELAQGAGFSSEQVGVYLQPTMQGRNCHLEFSIPYGAAEAEKALEFYQQTVDALLARGAFFSRPHGPAAERVFAQVPGHVAMLEKMRSLLDPQRIMNRGKLCF